MFKDLRIRVVITLIVAMVSLYYLVPTLVTDLPISLKPYFPKEKIRLGLDLQGGMHLVLEVDTEKTVEGIVERLSGNLKESLMDRNVRFRNLERTKGTTLSLELPGKEASEELNKVLQDRYPELEIKASEVVEGR
jgi:preprotein translocase subunit SecD